MISIIICSRSKLLSTNFSNNIRDTIGVKFEIIVIDNSANQYSIFSAYNEGIKQSIYPYLCFIHEDIVFHTIGWGKILIKYFDEIPLLGCLGIAGANYKTQAPSAWWDVPRTEWVINIIQHNKQHEKVKQLIGWNKERSFKEVAVLDGVFLVTKKSNCLTFDSELTGFHCYDLNICIEASKKKLIVAVTNEILVEHFSGGSVDKDWVMLTHIFHVKNKKFLPISVKNEAIGKSVEVNNLIHFINKAFSFGLLNIAIHYWMYLIKLKPLSKFHLIIIKRLIKRR